MTANWEVALQVYGMLAAVFVPLLAIGRRINDHDRQRQNLP